MNLKTAVNITDLEQLARRKLPRLAFDYIAGGAEDETGLAHNTAAFARYRLVPRFFTASKAINLETDLFGKSHGLPFGIAPTGIAGLFHPEGDVALARAALAANIPYIMSGTSTAAIEDLPPACAKNTWYQLYTGKDRGIDEDILRRAKAAGIETLVLTVDSEVRTKRERDIRNDFFAPRPKTTALLEAMLHPSWVRDYLKAGGRPTFGNFVRYAGSSADARAVMAFMTSHIPGHPTWDDLLHFRRHWTGRLVVKGLLDPRDVLRAAEAGVDGVIVSNHGARQLDRAPTAVEMLPAIRDAAGDKTTLMIDGGIRRGSDIITALCLGAQFVFTGRATLYGLAVGGYEGTTRAIEILREELDSTGRQMGCTSVAHFTDDRLYDSVRASI